MPDVKTLRENGWPGMAKCYYTVRLHRKEQLTATDLTAAKASKLHGSAAGERKAAGVSAAAVSGKQSARLAELQQTGSDMHGA